MGKIRLSNGDYIPDFCFGTGIISAYRSIGTNKLDNMKIRTRLFLNNRKQYDLDKNFRKVIEAAVENGICMFDTSRAYGGAEHELGQVLNRHDRSKFYVVSKLCNADQYSGNVRQALMRSLKELNMEYLDLYLMHWPVEGVWLDNWKKMEELCREGLCRAIGVCNCNIHHLRELSNQAEIMPVVDEFECHPLFTQDELRKYCRENHIQVMAYTSTGRMDERLKKTVIAPISKKYGKSMAQVILRWHQQIGNIPIVNSNNIDHLIENAHIDDFSLTEQEIEEILRVNINSRLRYDPDNCDFRQL